MQLFEEKCSFTEPIKSISTDDKIYKLCFLYGRYGMSKEPSEYFK